MQLPARHARERLVSWLGLARPQPLGGEAGARALLQQLRCIQLDPLDVIGTNADLVARARVDGLAREEVYPALMPPHGTPLAFEHFAKERCLVRAALFPAYRARAQQTPWWRLGERLRKLPDGALDDVLDEIRARGPLTVAELSDRGRVEPVDWSGWKGTSKVATMALRVLWTRCQVVVRGRRGRHKLYDLPERVLPDASTPSRPLECLLLDRIAACGLMPNAFGPWWGGLRSSRDDGTLAALEARGDVVRLRVGEARRDHLALPAFLDHDIVEPDRRLRILGPLDPLLWDRKLVQQLWGFDYTWEVYTPSARRRYGWYVVPLLHRGRLIGRMEAHTDDAGRVVVDKLWPEGGRFPHRALERAVARSAR